jgi:hypothetical protein
MQISFDMLVQAVVKAVIAELNRQGIEVTGMPGPSWPRGDAGVSRSVEIDFSEYKTPVLAERQVQGVARAVAEIIVPHGTIVTEGAKDLIDKRKMKLTIKSPSH